MVTDINILAEDIISTAHAAWLPEYKLAAGKDTLFRVFLSVPPEYGTPRLKPAQATALASVATEMPRNMRVSIPKMNGSRTHFIALLNRALKTMVTNAPFTVSSSCAFLSRVYH